MLIRRIPNPQNPGTQSKRSVWKKFFWGVLILIIGIAGWIGVTGALALKNISAENNTESPSFFRFSGEVPPDQLRAEGDGRINILLIGIGGAGHPGGQLADTIQIFSLDPINKSSSMLSLPRDLYVKIPNNGMSKINAVYPYGNEQCKKKNTCKNSVDAGANALKDTVSSVLGVPIHYFARIDFKGFEQFIDSIGGVQIYLDKPINDPLFPDEQLKGYQPFYLAAGYQKLNGKTALKVVRSRHGANGSDFARADRQQKVIKAVQEKMLSLNVLGNPKKITDLITILGNHLKTDLSVDDMRRLAGLIKTTDNSKAVSKVLDTSADGPLKSTNDPKAGYIIIPKKGLNDFSEVQEFALTILKEPYLIKENARLLIVDASGKAGVGDQVASKLKKLGYNVVSTQVAAAPKTATTITYFDNTPYTNAFLKKRFGTNPVKGKAADRQADAQVILTIGSTYKAK